MENEGRRLEIEEIETRIRQELVNARTIVEVAVAKRDDGEFVVRPASVIAGPGRIVLWLNCTSDVIAAQVPAALGELHTLSEGGLVEAVWLQVPLTAPSGSYRYEVHVTQAQLKCRGESSPEIIIKGR
jgi:hypothetical protein